MMYGFDYSGSGGWWMVVAMVIVAVAVVAVVWLIVHRPGVNAARSTAQDLLRERFARGEITSAQYEDAKRVLGA